MIYGNAKRYGRAQGVGALTTLRKAARQEHVARRASCPSVASVWGSITCRHHGQHYHDSLPVRRGGARGSGSHARPGHERGAPSRRQAQREGGQSSRLLEDHATLPRRCGRSVRPPERTRVPRARGPRQREPVCTRAIEKKESGTSRPLRSSRRQRVSKARKLPKDDERTKLRATRGLLAATGVTPRNRSGAPSARAGAVGEGHAPMEALGVGQVPRWKALRPPRRTPHATKDARRRYC